MAIHIFIFNFELFYADTLFGVGLILQSLILPCACYLAIFGKKVSVLQVNHLTELSNIAERNGV